MWLMVVLLGTFVSHTTSAYSNVYFQDTPVGEYSDYTSPRVLLNGDCAMFRVRFSGGSDVALKVTLEVQNYDSYRPNVEYLAIAAPSWAGQPYNNSVDDYIQCSLYFEQQTCWDGIPHMAHINTRNEQCQNKNLAKLGNSAFASIELQDQYSHYTDQLKYNNEMSFYFLGSDIESCETYPGDYLIFVKGTPGRNAYVQLHVQDESVSMYCWASTPEAWVLMWIIVILPFIIFAAYFRIKAVYSYCKVQVAPDALTVAELENENEPVHAGIPIGSPKPCVIAQVVENDGDEDDEEETSKHNEDDEDAPVVSPVQRVSTTARVMSLIRAAVPMNRHVRVQGENQRDEYASNTGEEEEDISIGTRISRYGTRGVESNNNGSTGDVRSNGSSVAMFS